MQDIQVYKNLIKGIQEDDPEKLKFILGKKTKLQYLNQLKESMDTDICDWQRWYSKLNRLMDKER